MRIEKSQVQLSAHSSLSREQARFRLGSERGSGSPVDTVVARAKPEHSRFHFAHRVAETLLGHRLSVHHRSDNRDSAPSRPPEDNHPQVQVRSVAVNSENEQVVFEAKGTVETSDGRQIDFQAKLQLAQQFVQVTESAGTNTAAAAHVLALNLGAPGRGLLFADRNGDGAANSGAELFGPTSGNAFAELKQKDADGNGWIDEGDPIYGELRVWFRAPDGPGRVYTLADLGVGAIYTSGVATPFDLRAAQDGVLGQIRSTGIYLQESGLPGIVQQVDLAASNSEPLPT